MAERQLNRQPVITETYGAQVGALGRRYGEFRHKASVTFGEAGDGFKVQRDKLYEEMVGLTAATLIAAPESERTDILARTPYF